MAQFDILYNWGDHKIFNYNKEFFKFREYFEKLYETADLENLHRSSSVYDSSELRDIETELHKKFYKDIHSNNDFKELYCSMIQSIYNTFFKDEKHIIFQSFPSIRFQFINNTTVPPHYDSDSIGMHPIGEKNFLLPITRMYGTNRLFIESEPGKADYQGIDLNYGNLFMFNGNKCMHYNEKNVENTLRISLDFRTILHKDYMAYINKGDITNTNPRDPDNIRSPVKMIIGGYYQYANANANADILKWHKQKNLLLQTMPNFDINEANACFEYMKDGTNFVTEFKQTSTLEKMIGEFIGVKHVLMTTSGSMALAVALLGCDIGAGDDVIVPDYTMIATINAVKMVGANPIIVDVDRTSFTLTTDFIKEHRTPNTKCVLFVSINNRQTDLEDIQKYCESSGLTLIEDAAQSLGARINGKHFGTFGSVGCFSLSTPKIISTGQGGFVVTNDDSLASKMSMIKNFGRKCGGIDVFERFGLNLKFTDIQAVIGIEQMKKLPNRVIYMKDLYCQYYNGLKETPVYMIPPGEDYLPWFIDIYTDKRDELATFLKTHNIQTRPAYPEIHKTPMYFSNKEYNNSSYVSENGLYLPSHTHLTQAEVHHICNLIRCFFL